MDFDLVVKSGTLVTTGDSFVADIGIRGETIAAIGNDLRGTKTIDASGKLVLPGAIDPHVHLDMPQGEAVSSDDFETGTIAAAHGGTTTIIDFVEPDAERDEPLMDGLEKRRALADECSVIDYGLHMTIRSGDPSILAQVPEAVRAGCSSFKTYLTYEGFRLDDHAFLAACEAVAKAGGLLLVHAENDAAIEYLRGKLIRAGEMGPSAHPRSRPPAVEGEAVERALALAEIAGCPIYVVHVSTARGAEAVARARARGQAAFGETCPQYLVLDDSAFNAPGFEAAKFVCSPPIRPADNPPALWKHLAEGSLSSVGTDHCPFFYESQKRLGLNDFRAIPNGLPGIEARLALLYTFGVRRGRLSLNRWVEVCCAAPARIFGLYPKKGALVPGADADIVIFDPEREITLSTETLHERVDYTVYDGFRLRGWPAMTIVRGEVMVDEGKFVGTKGRGRFLKRG